MNWISRRILLKPITIPEKSIHVSLPEKTAYEPLNPDHRRRVASRRSPIIKRCPECGKDLRARSEKQWEFVYYAHKMLSKKHRLGASSAP